MHANSSFQYSLLGSNNTNKVFIKLESIEVVGYGLKQKSVLQCFLGPRNKYKLYEKDFTLAEGKPDEYWSFVYTDPNRASFVLELDRYNLLFPNEVLGKAELILRDFKPNEVTRKEIIIRGNNNANNYTRITLLVHPSEDGSPAFKEY